MRAIEKRIAQLHEQYETDCIEAMGIEDYDEAYCYIISLIHEHDHDNLPFSGGGALIYALRTCERPILLSAIKST